MPRLFALYVPASAEAQRNLRIGLENLEWGWKDSALDRADARTVAGSIRSGDVVAFGMGGPSPRTGVGSWANASLTRAVFLRITRGLHSKNDHPWPDDLYPNRVRFEVLTDTSGLPGHGVGADMMEALRMSANKMGVPVLVGDTAHQLPLALTIGDTDDVLDPHGKLDVFATILVRAEQAKIRRRKFGGRETLTCDLCERTLPARFVRAAHIKRRSACTIDEMRDLANIMAACLFGCDEMFEHGYVGVDPSGRVVARPGATGDLATAVNQIVGRTVASHRPASGRYFAWHNTEHGVDTVSGPPV